MPSLPTPIGKDLHPQVQVDGSSQEFLDVLTSRGIEISNGRPPFSNQESLLGVPLDEDTSLDVDRLLLFPELLDLAKKKTE
jgi:hypothetical protein